MNEGTQFHIRASVSGKYQQFQFKNDAVELHYHPRVLLILQYLGLIICCGQQALLMALAVNRDGHSLDVGC